LSHHILPILQLLCRGMTVCRRLGRQRDPSCKIVMIIFTQICCGCVLGENRLAEEVLMPLESVLSHCQSPAECKLVRIAADVIAESLPHGKDD
jgi:hypothetical protein